MEGTSNGAADPWVGGGATGGHTGGGFHDNGNQFGDGGAFGQEGGPSDDNCRK